MRNAICSIVVDINELVQRGRSIAWTDLDISPNCAEILSLIVHYKPVKIVCRGTQAEFQFADYIAHWNRASLCSVNMPVSVDFVSVAGDILLGQCHPSELIC